MDSATHTRGGSLSSVMQAQGTHAPDRAANAVLSAVLTGVDTYGTKSVTAVGHSLGAALSLLDAVFLPLHIPGLTVTYYGYGLPRVRTATEAPPIGTLGDLTLLPAQVGNQDFANYVDGKLGGRFTRITNYEDPIPILPGRFLGFHHPSGEAHIDDGQVWKWCPGQDNTDAQCSIGDTTSILDSDIGDHDGPYNGINIGC